MVEEGWPCPPVFDNGSYMIRCGYSGDDKPSTIFPSLIGKPKYLSTSKNEKDKEKETFIGYDAQSKRGLLSINHPIQKGIITNFDDMEKIWYHSIRNDLRSLPVNDGIMMTEISFNPKPNREKSIEISLEKLKTCFFFIANQSVLSLYSTGRITGTVVDLGYEVSHIVPVYEGFSIQHNISTIDIGGKQLDEYLMKMLIEKGYYIDEMVERNTMRELKEKYCFISTNNNDINEKDLEIEYKLPDGQMITIGKERYQCPEALFNNSLIDNSKNNDNNSNQNGIHTITNDTILKCDKDIRNELYNNIILSGGTSLINNLKERLQNEMKQKVSQETNCNIHLPSYRNSAWIGASILASLSTFESMFIWKEEYEEIGASIVHKKCFM